MCNMDWAGTAIDYGCFAPVSAFIESFKSIGINVTAREAREPMGLSKIDHIRALFNMKRIGEAFQEKYGRPYNENDVVGRYNEFQRLLFATLREYTALSRELSKPSIYFASEISKSVRQPGYTREMMDIVMPEAARKGYQPDNCVTADNLPAGRPYPYMIYKNMCDLAVPSRYSVLKYGDTIADIKEGLNAGVWTVGVILGSNELGLTEDEVKAMPEAELKRCMQEVRMRMYAAGAHYVLDTIEELPALIESINNRMNIKENNF